MPTAGNLLDRQGGCQLHGLLTPRAPAGDCGYAPDVAVSQRPTRRERAHRGIDSAILWRLGALRYDTAAFDGAELVSPAAFWAESRVSDAVPVSVTHAWDHRNSRELRLEGASDGPGTHPGARKLIATAHITRGLPADAPVILLVHGYAVPVPIWDELQARRLRALGAHTIRIDLPFHLRRRVPGQGSGEGFFGSDPARIRATVRQSVEDAAALVAWARREISPVAGAMGVSLGGLIVSHLAAQVELESVVAVAPLCDPPSTFLTHMPRNLARRLGLSATSGGAWGDDRAAARDLLEATLAPLVLRNLVPRTPPPNITLVRPELDLIVGPEPIGALAQAWGVEVWDYPYGHITVMNAPGITQRIHDRLLDIHGQRDVDVVAAAG